MPYGNAPSLQLFALSGAHDAVNRPGAAPQGFARQDERRVIEKVDGLAAPWLVDPAEVAGALAGGRQPPTDARDSGAAGTAGAAVVRSVSPGPIGGSGSATAYTVTEGRISRLSPVSAR